MSAPLQFWGTAHPPPRKDGSRDGIADLSSAEIASTDMGKNSTSVLVEHDKSARVGTVSASWEAMDGSLHVAGTIHDPKAAQDVRSGKMRGLSLGTSVIHDGKGNALCRSQEEISICEVPRRSNCWISRIDGVPVLQTVNCSQKRACLPSSPAPIFPSLFSLSLFLSSLRYRLLDKLFASLNITKTPSTQTAWLRLPSLAASPQPPHTSPPPTQAFRMRRTTWSRTRTPSSASSSPT